MSKTQYAGSLLWNRAQMRFRLPREQLKPAVLGLLALVAAGGGAALGWYAGYVSQAVVAEVSFPGETGLATSWTCSVHLNNEDSFRIFTGSGTGSAAFYYVQSILATCRKTSDSIYSIHVGFKTLTGQRLGGTSAGFPSTTNFWSRGGNLGWCEANICPHP